MENFVFQNPTKLIFGKDQLDRLHKELPNYGKKVLLVYGGGSIKQNGLYDKVIDILNACNKEVFELSGVEPNPRLSTVERGVTICKHEGVEFVLAVGGGSVIDCTKAICVGAKFDGQVWDFITRKHIPNDAIPFGTVLTLAATGSEMNSGSVITNWDTKEKYGWGSPLVFPKFSILDPTNTFTVPKDHTIYGIVDMMTHVFESYFHPTTNTPLQERMSEAVLLTVIEAAPKLMEDLDNYEFRETILYSGTIALNGFLQMGARGDWASHNIEHAISAVYDIPHAGGLAIIYPQWLRHVKEVGLIKLVQLAVRVWNVDPNGKSEIEIAEEGIRKLEQFWQSLGAPARLADYQIDSTNLDLIADKAMARGEFGNYKKLNKENVLEILTNSL